MGETGSGKTTLAKLLTRLMDPTEGSVLLDGVDLRDVRFDSLRSRVVLVPQEGFLFDATLLENIRFGRPGATTDGGLAVPDRARPRRVARRAAAAACRRRSASAASRCRPVSGSWSRWPGPTSPTPTCSCSTRRPRRSTRPPRSGSQRALDGLTRGRTSIAIAHRLSTAEAADEVVVVDRGRVVERGPHRELVDAGGVYSAAARLVGRPAAEPDRRPGTLARPGCGTGVGRAPRGARDTAE